METSKWKKTTTQSVGDFLKALVKIEAQGYKIKVGRYEKWLYCTGEKLKIRGNKLKTKGIVNCPIHPTKNGNYFPTSCCPDCRYRGKK